MKTISAKKYLFGMLVLPVYFSGVALAHDFVEDQDRRMHLDGHEHLDGHIGHDGSGYVIDSSGFVVQNSDPDNLCWRTGYWDEKNAENATEHCDAHLLPEPEPEPEPEPVVQAPEKITFSADALFDFDSAKLKPEGELALDDFASKLENLDYDLIIATGYTDRIGNEDYNKKLSVRRAEAVKEYLVTNKGIDPDRIFTDGKGEANPVTGDTCKSGTGGLISCLAPDRRVEIEVAGTR